MRGVVLWAALMLSQYACAQVAPFTYSLGALQVTEDAENIVIATVPPIHIQILPGGHTWPRLTLDEEGNIYVGDSVVSSRGSGSSSSPVSQTPDEQSLTLPDGFHITAHERTLKVVRGADACAYSLRQLGLAGRKGAREALEDGNVTFRVAQGKLLALSTWLGADNSETRYTIVDMDLTKCRTRHTTLGNPDLLVELGASSRGGWWATGSIEQTLLHSKDGKRWRPVALPADLSALLSAYIVDERRMWLAGYMAHPGESDPGIVYTDDGGKRWKNIALADPVLATLPRGWLEGWRRLGRPIQQ